MTIQLRGVTIALVLLATFSQLAAFAQNTPPTSEIVQDIQARDDVSHGEMLPGSVTTQEHLTVYDTPSGKTATFVGKVAGLDSYDGVAVGIIYLTGVQWVHLDNYQWQSVNPDGTFTITADRQPEASKTLAVKAPNHPWTFLHYDFNSGESANDIVVNIGKPRHVKLLVKGSDGVVPAGGFSVEVFNGRQYVDMHSNCLRYQRAGQYRSTGTPLDLYLPDDMTGLYVVAPGLAAYYEIIDPSKADLFVFHLLSQGSLSGIVLLNGNPVADAKVLVGCRDVPLSWRVKPSGKDGRFTVAQLPPGKYSVSVNGKEMPSAEVTSGSSKYVALYLDDKPAAAVK